MTDSRTNRIEEIAAAFEEARHLEVMSQVPGWKIFQKRCESRIEQIKTQFMTTAMDKDALWAAQVRLKGIIEFYAGIIDDVKRSVETLEPEVMTRILASEQLDPLELDGELRPPEPDEVML